MKTRTLILCALIASHSAIYAIAHNSLDQQDESPSEQDLIIPRPSFFPGMLDMSGPHGNSNIRTAWKKCIEQDARTCEAS